MKKRITILMTTLLLTISVLSGCGAESTTTEPTETATATTTEESTTEQAEEATATSEETAEPTPEVKEEPSEETTAETEPETTETAEPEPAEEPTPESEPQATYTYTDMSATMYAQQTVNVRDLPDTSGNKVGSLSANDEIAITGKCNETGWYRFDYNGNVAYVSNKYVGDEKVEVAPPASNNSGSGSANSGSVASNWADSYPKYQWIDMGEYFFYIANTQAEANQMCCYDYTHSVREVLESRYSDRSVYEAAAPTLKGNVPICWVSTVIYDENYDVAYIPTFIWN